MFCYLFLALVPLSATQQVGNLVPETHPRLNWKRCKPGQVCDTVQGEIVLDSNWRWLHEVDGIKSCYEGNEWNNDVCTTLEACTDICAIEGAEYEHMFGIATSNDRVSLKYKATDSLSSNVNSRVFLMETEDKYQTFTLMDNELTFDVDLSLVECGINSALYLVAMESDGGMASYPDNKAGAKYGTGYCDATCLRSNHFANVEGWVPSSTDRVSGEGNLGACCPEFDVWNSNAHSYSTSSKPCVNGHYQICENNDCDPRMNLYPDGPFNCDRFGCDYNPYRLGNTDFYGKGKSIDTTRPFTVVTRFEQTNITQFFLQGGQTIKVPAPAYQSFPERSGLSEEYCESLTSNFNLFRERDAFSEVGGWEHSKDTLQQPMILAMAIQDDHWAHNLWLDSVFPPDFGGEPGANRGPCDSQGGDPQDIGETWPNAKVVFSNIRFGPIGSTVEISG